MSLINDALKRAGQVPPPPPLPPAEATKGLQPVPEQPAQSPFQVPLIVFPILLVIIIALAGFFLIRGLGRKSAARGRAFVTHVQARERPADPLEIPNASDEQAPPAVQTSQPVIVRTETASAPPADVLSAPPTQVPTAPVIHEPALPLAATPADTSRLKVQGIFYRSKDPAAVVNSKMVHVGDRVGDSKVIAIGKDSVTIESAGQQKIFKLF